MSRIPYYEKTRSTLSSGPCHWPGCTRKVTPAMWGCQHHWLRLPKELRDKVWREYEPGQETRGPSAAYLAVMEEIREWISKQKELDK